MGFKEIEVGFPSAQPDRLRLRPPADRGGPDPRRRHDPGADPGARAPDRAHASSRSAAPTRAIVHLYNSTSTLQRRVVFGLDRDGIKDIAVQGAQLVPEVRRDDARTPTCATSTRRRASPAPSSTSPSRSATRSSTCSAADAGAQGHHQPAGHGRDGHAQRLRRPDRVDAPQPRAPRLDRAVAAPAQRPRHRRRRRRAGLDGRRRPRRGLAVRQRRAHRQRLPRDARPEPVHPGRRPASSTSPTSTRSAAPSSTATSCRCTRATPTAATWSSRRSPARTRTRSRRASKRWTRRRARRQTGRRHRVGRAVPADRPEGRRPHLRGGDPRQQPVRQGRRRLHHAAASTSWSCRAGCRSSSARSSRRTPTPRAARSRRSRCGRSSRPSTSRPTTPAAAQRGAHVVGRRARRTPLTVGLYVDGQRQELEGHGNGPIAAFVDALCSGIGHDVRVLDYAEHAHERRRRREGRGVPRVRDRRTRSAGASASTPTSSPPRSRPWSARSTGQCALAERAALGATAVPSDAEPNSLVDARDVSGPALTAG